MSRVDTGTLLVVSVVVGGTGDSNDDGEKSLESDEDLIIDNSVFGDVVVSFFKR